MNYKLVLASGSPRRQQLFQELCIPFTVRVVPVEEDHPGNLPAAEVAAYLAKKKGQVHQKLMTDDELIITADTVVVVNDHILNKPNDAPDACRMLAMLSGQAHQVITGVSLTSSKSVNTFSDTTTVHFRALIAEEIDFYVQHYQPYDKAGGYAIQEWIGMVGIEKIEGSYYNVVGLPIEVLYRKLQEVTKLALMPR